MYKTLCFSLLLGLQSCVSFGPSPRRTAPAAPPPPVLVEKIDDEQFAKMDLNKDGKLDKSELNKVTSPTDEWGATKIFLILIAAIAAICMAPLVPPLIQKFINKCKSCESKEK